MEVTCKVGTYFNPRNESFKKDTKNTIYIDKTGLLNLLNRVIGSSENCIAVSHARRFGKSQAAGMIDAYYSKGCDSRELFSSYEIAKSDDFEVHLNKYNVIHLDISSFTDFYKENLVDKIWELLYNELKEKYKDIMDKDNPIGAVLGQVYEKSDCPFVIIIDEWDCVVRNHADRPDLVKKYLQFLHSLFKSEESKKFLALAYITGILPIKKIKDESALNNFREYTMINAKNLTDFFGFTEDEVKSLCEEYGMEFDTIKSWYNGYLINGKHMYNPNSICQAMVYKEVDSYWKNTSSFDSINTYITLNFDGLKDDVLSMLAGKRVEVDVETFTNDLSEISCRDDALTALIHLGYLAYDFDEQEAYVPNYEVAKAYQLALKRGEWKEVAQSISMCEALLKATIKKDSEKVAELIELAHSAYTSIIKYNDENSLSSVLAMAYFTAPAYYNIVREFPSGKGFADMVLLPRKDSGNRPAMIIELKWNENADTAIRQIKDRRYMGDLKGYGDKILLVGISYNKNSNNKKHECIIEEWNL